MSAVLEAIQGANRSFLAGNPTPLPDAGEPFMVLTCIDPRLTGWLESACGLPRGRALVVRTAGNQVDARTPDVVRTLAVGVYLKGATEIFVIGHTDCALARFSATEVIDRFRSAGVARSAFGEEDLRTWFGAFQDVRENVRRSVRNIRAAGVLAPGFVIHGLVIDIESGALELLHPENAPVLLGTAATPPAVRPSPEPAPQAPPPPPRPPVPGAAAPVRISAPAPPGPAERAAVPSPGEDAAPPTSMLDAAMIVREFVLSERGNQKFQRMLADFNVQLRRERNPIAVYNALDRVARDYHTAYPRLPGALAYCKKALAEHRGAGASFLELVRRVLD